MPTLLFQEDLFEALLALICGAAFAVLVYHAIQKREFIVHGVACVGAGALFLFYALLALGVEPLANSMELRLLIFRPSFVSFALAQTLIIANGNLARSRLGVWIQTRFNSRS